MPLDRFMIAPLNTGLQTNVRPWQIMDDAFTTLQNAVIFRGRLRKRFGTTLMGSVQQSRFRISVGTIGSPVAIPVQASYAAAGQQFSAGAQIFTVYQTGTPAAMLATGIGTGTYNTSTGAYVLSGTGLSGATVIYYYPAMPVMGLTQYEIGAINNHPSFGFDPDFCYEFTPNLGWDRAGTPTGSNPLPIWHGSNSQFFWTTNWDGFTANQTVMFTTNFNAFITPSQSTGTATATDDPIWTYGVPNETTWTPLSYEPLAALNPTNTQPYTVTQTKIGSPTIIINYVQQARIIVAFQGRLLLLNTIENNNNGAGATTPITPANYLTSTNTQFKNRVRYSHRGSPFSTTAWLEPNVIYDPGTGALVGDGGGFVDATTEEAIISAEFIKDRLIVYFERSTWELAYTGNEVFPFVFQKINQELGSQATFSTVPFDKQVLTIGNTGVHSCSGTLVERIDDNIPDEIFEFKVENDAQLRTCGIRDYQTEMVYWSFVQDNETPTTQIFPNQILVYNYKNGAWAMNDDCFTAFGYFEQQTDTTWASSTLTWAQANFTWVSGIIQAQQRVILAGTPEGFVLIIDPNVSRNAPSMQITTMTIPSTASGANYVDLQVFNHNLALNDYVAVENTIGISLPILTIYQVTSIIDINNVTIFAPDISGSYLGGGTLARVSNIEVVSKQWNPYQPQDRNVYLAKIDFGVQRTANGQITVDYYPSSTELSMLDEGNATGSIMGTSILETSPYALYPLEAYQELLFHPVYFQSTGQFIQISMYMSPAQLSNTAISWSDFELQNITLFTQPTSQRME